MALHPFLLFTNQGSRILSAKLKKHIPSILIFVAGFSIGCWVSSDRVDFFHEASSTPDTKPTKLRENRPVRTPNERKWQNFGETVAQLPDEEQDKIVETLDPHDRAIALEELLAQSGPDGLSDDLADMVINILIKWGTEDFDEAWKWASSSKPEPTKIFSVQILLVGLAERDPNKALALYYEMEKISPKYETDLPEIILNASARKGTDEFIEILNQFNFSESERTFIGAERGISVEFSPDFDFKRAADAAVILIQKNGGQIPERFPENFIYEWGKRDHNAADKWMMKNDILPFNDWSSLNNVAQEALGAKEAGVWMARKLESSDKHRQSLLEMLLSFSSESNIEAIAAAMPNTMTRDKFLEDLVSSNGGHYSVNCTGKAMSLLSTPTARLAALRKIQSENDWVPNDEELKSMGITRAQFDELNESKKTE